MAYGGEVIFLFTALRYKSSQETQEQFWLGKQRQWQVTLLPTIIFFHMNKLTLKKLFPYRGQWMNFGKECYLFDHFESVPSFHDLSKTATRTLRVWQHTAHGSQINTKQFYGAPYFTINKTLKKETKGLLIQTIPPELSLINKSSTSRWERYLKTKTKEHRVSTLHSCLANAAKPLREVLQ